MKSTRKSFQREGIAFLLAILSTTPLVARAQKLPPNAVSSSRHYRESGIGNATGRAGTVVMTARALLGKDGQSTVELTTGTLDSSGTPPGSFDKVQFKPLDTKGEPLFTHNFTPLSTATGYYSFTWPSLFRKQQIQLQGNIRGIDGNRASVVTVVETTKLQPDLNVLHLTFPGAASANQLVNLSANVVEMNSDVGATTTCVLAIDGNTVDQINHVFVDAGGSVSCAFTYRFISAGNHTIQVTAANVIPADWDTGNNSASGTIAISNSGTTENSYADFFDETGSFPRLITGAEKVWNFGKLTLDYSVSSGTTGREQQSYVLFYSAGCAGSTNAVAWQFPVSLSYAEAMDGTPVYSSRDTINGSSTSYAVADPICSGQAASYAYESADNFVNDHWEFLYSDRYYDKQAKLLYSQQVVELERYAGDITYFSYGYQCIWSGVCTNPSDYYTWNSSGTSVYGTLVPLGQTWKPSLATRDAAGNTFSGSLSVPLTGQQERVSQPYSCYSYGPDANGYAYQSCNSADYDYVYTHGSLVQ